MDTNIDLEKIHALIISEIADLISESERQCLDAALSQSEDARTMYEQIKAIIDLDKIRQAEERMGPDMAWKIIAEAKRIRQLHRKRLCMAAAMLIVVLITYLVNKQ